GISVPGHSHRPRLREPPAEVGLELVGEVDDYDQERKSHGREEAHLGPLPQHVAIERAHRGLRHAGRSKEPGQLTTRRSASTTSLQSPPWGAFPGLRMRHSPNTPAAAKTRLGVHIARNGDTTS